MQEFKHGKPTYNNVRRINELNCSKNNCQYIYNVLIDSDIVKSTEKEWHNTIIVGDQQVNFKLNTGAQVIIFFYVSYSIFSLKLKNKLIPVDVSLLSYVTISNLNLTNAHL